MAGGFQRWMAGSRNDKKPISRTNGTTNSHGNGGANPSLILTPSLGINLNGNGYGHAT